MKPRSNYSCNPTGNSIPLNKCSIQRWEGLWGLGAHLAEDPAPFCSFLLLAGGHRTVLEARIG